MIRILQLISIVILLSGLGPLNASFEEKAEINFAKAELALVEGKTNLAIKLLGRNISNEYFHLATYELLAEIFIKSGLHIKALRTYSVMVKKIHTPKLFEATTSQDLESELLNAPVASTKAVEIYFKMAQLYIELFQNGIFNQSYNYHLLQSAKKYFTICHFYEYMPYRMQLEIAKIQTHLKNYPEAIKDLLALQEELKTKNRQDEMDESNYLLGDAFYRAGKAKEALSFLKESAFSLKTNPAIKKYSYEYLESIHQKYLTLSLGYRNNYSNNVYLVTDEEYEVLKGNGINQKSSSFSSYHANAYYINRFTDNLAFNLDLHFFSNSFPEATQDMNNMYFSSEIEIVYLKSIEYSLGLKFFEQQYYKSLEFGGKRKKSMVSIGVIPTYSYKSKTGLMTYDFILKATRDYQKGAYLPDGNNLVFSHQLSEDRISSGLAFSYSPFLFTDYFNPTYSFEYLYVEEGKDELNETLRPSHEVTVTLSNLMNLSEKDHLNFDFSIIVHHNTSEDISYRYINISSFYSHSFQFFRSWSLDLHLSYGQFISENERKVSNINTGLGISTRF